MYSVKVESIPDDYYYRNRLIITDDIGERDHWDGGEPEDNSFIRDWDWVKGELLNAYEQGKKDGQASVYPSPNHPVKCQNCQRMCYVPSYCFISGLWYGDTRRTLNFECPSCRWKEKIIL